MDARLLKSIELPALPEVAQRILVAMEDEHVSLERIEGIVSKDFALSSSLLKLANSAFFRRSGHIATVSDALMTVGFNVAKSLLIALSFRQISSARSPFERALWMHQLGASLYSFFIASEIRLPVPGEALVAGLVHDIGKAVLNKCLSEKYAAVISRVRNEDAAFMTAERDLLGTTHCEIGGLVLDNWKLPQDIRAAVEQHHGEHSSDARRADKLAAILALADAICWSEGIGFSSLADQKALELYSLVGLTPEAFARLREEVKEIYESQKDLFMSL